MNTGLSGASIGDIAIGQVELKDADTTTEANIKAANTARTTATTVLAVQQIDATGKVPSATPYPLSLTLVGRGEVQGNAAATVLPTLTCRIVEIKAVWSNAGNVYIGGSGVTKPDGTTDTTTGWELAPGEAEWFVVTADMNELYRICDNAGDDVVYRAYN